MNNMEQLKEFMGCFLFGKCYKYDYEYTFIYDGKEMKTTEGCNTFWGDTTCKFEGIEYKNVNYTSKFLEKREYQGFPFGNIIIPIIFYFVCKGLLMSAIRRG